MPLATSSLQLRVAKESCALLENRTVQLVPLVMVFVTMVNCSLGSGEL